MSSNDQSKPVDPRVSTTRKGRLRTKTDDGRSVFLDSLPLVAYALNCGHLGRDYAISKGDIIFCNDCQRNAKVSRIIAA